jgi:hypothetical protein
VVLLNVIHPPTSKGSGKGGCKQVGGVRGVGGFGDNVKWPDY